jgi:DHA1 family tetracycline resistance protein-like MFS transporter
LKRAFHWKGLRIYFVASFAFAFGWAYYAEFIPITLMDQFSFGTAQVGQYFAYNGIWYGLSAGILTAPLLRRFSAEKLVIKSLLFSAVFMPLFVLINNPLYLLGYTPILMFLMALVFPTMAALVSNRTDPSRQGEVMGVYQSVSAVAFGISPLCGGTVIAAYPMMTIWGGAFLMLIAGMVLQIRSFGRFQSVKGPAVKLSSD